MHKFTGYFSTSTSNTSTMTMTMTPTKPNSPDSPPKSLYVGAINPFALVEAILGRRVDRRDPSTAQVLADVLQCDYEELFDMRHNSILYSGLQLNAKGDRAEPIPSREMQTLTERDLVTPDLSRVTRVGDLGEIGLRDINDTRVKHAYMQNGKLRLVLSPNQLGRTLSNNAVTSTIFELSTPFRKHKGEWSPPNSSWQDISNERFQMSQQQLAALLPMLNLNSDINMVRQGNPVTLSCEPVQGALGNSWLVAAMTAVAWADPSAINHFHRGRSNSDPARQERRTLAVKLYSKGGDNDSNTATIEVDAHIPVNNSSNQIIYCRSSGAGTAAAATGGNIMRSNNAGVNFSGEEIWPSLYEKAFAKWITRERGEHPDMTQTSHGDPVKAMCQLTDREAQYYYTERRSENELVGLIRTHSVNSRTIYPICAWTHPTVQRDEERQPGQQPGAPGSGDNKEVGHRRNSANVGFFRGSNLVANMAYTVLGWASPQETRQQFIILRHPWGVTEPEGLSSYSGLVDRVDSKFWRPADLIDRNGVFALDISSFKECFAGIGIAK